MSRLKIGVQKSGRLHEKSIELLKESGIHFPNGSSKLLAEASNFPLDILFLRDDDIPQYVEQGLADIGIVGQNVYAETRKQLVVLKELGFSSCRLSLAVPRDVNYPGLSALNGKKIATSYPNILGDYLRANQIEAEIEVISGSVEIAPCIGLADAICDIVSSGSTLRSNGLKEVEKIMQSQAVLVANQQLKAETKKVIEQLLFRINSVLSAREKKYILLNTPNDRIATICNLLPGMKSPTILPLAAEGWSSLHSVIEEDQFWQHIDELKAAGAEGILVLSIEKMIL